MGDPIPSQPVQINATKVQKILRKEAGSKNIWIVPHPQRPGAVVAHIGDIVKALDLVDLAKETLNLYEVPTHICTIPKKSKVSEKELMKIVPNPRDAVNSLSNSSSGEASGTDPMVEQVQEIFLELLNLDYIPPPTADFFQIGGSSMTASQLASKIRKTFGISCTGAEVFHHTTPLAVGDLIRSRQGGFNKEGETSAVPSSTQRTFHQATFPAKRLAPQSGFLASLVQLVPMFVVFPIWQINRYLLFFATLLQKSRWFPELTDRDFTSFLIAYVLFYMLWVTFAPLVFVAIKWIVIGRYKPGRYALWSSYYLRWWFVDTCRKLFLKGIWGSNDMMLQLYYGMLGVHMEDGARIASDCEIAEYDLIYLRKDAAVEQATLRGFGVDNGCMLLGYVKVGDGSSVGVRSVVAPNTCVPDGLHLGPGTSTYDDTPGKTYHPKHARVNRQMLDPPPFCSQLLFGLPLTFLVHTFAQIPPLLCTWTLLQYKARENSDFFFSEWNQLLDWLCDPRRIPFFFAIRIARAMFSPFFYMFCALIVKKCVIGKIQPGPLNPHDQSLKLRLWLLDQLFTRKKVQAVADLIGRHYGSVSVLYRLLGAQVGERVFWPGKQPSCNGLYDLLEIGDDVVFGSRSALIFTSVDRLDKIIVCAGGNVSDNCIVMPGSVISKNAVLGSNSICSEGMFLPSGSVWFGSTGGESQCLEAGDGSDSLQQYQRFMDDSDNVSPGLDRNDDVLRSKNRTPLKSNRKISKIVGPPRFIASQVVNKDRLQMKGDNTTIRPVGRAVYLGKTKGYCFLPVPFLIFYAWVTRIFCTIFHTMPLLLAVQFGAVILYSDNVAQTAYDGIFGEGETSEGGTFYSDTGKIFNEDTFLWFERDFENEGHFHGYPSVFGAVLVSFLFTHFIRVLLWIIIELFAKWFFMWKRQPGRYDYDTSSYALRWELYQLSAKIKKLGRLNMLQFIAGTPYMNWYMRANGGKIGKDVWVYEPLAPEIDLLELGDRVVIHGASAVGHLNTRGQFKLAKIKIDKDCTLRNKSRVQQGVHMEEGSMLLEKSIAMTGEVLDKHSVWQGCPASMWFQYDKMNGGEVGDVRFGYTPPTSGSHDIEMGTIRK